MPRARRLAGLLLTVAIAFGAVAGSAIEAVADDDGTNASQPSRWPVGPGATPRLEGSAHALRLLGPDRFQTNLAVTLALRGRGGFPYTTSDRTGDGDTSLAAASDWWGARSCPKSVIVVAGDNFADALAATSLSDPTDRGVGPLLERVAAADPLFDPVGGFARVDMALAPIIVTPSGRQRATSLAVERAYRGAGHGPRRMYDGAKCGHRRGRRRGAALDRARPSERRLHAGVPSRRARSLRHGGTRRPSARYAPGSRWHDRVCRWRRHRRLGPDGLLRPVCHRGPRQRDVMPPPRTHRRARGRRHRSRRARRGVVDELLAGARPADRA